MELTIREIKEKQIQLKVDLEDILNKFNQETGLKVRGDIDFIFKERKEVQGVRLNYDNPF